jgi:putative aldouronate transport system substrate-binding protein
VLLKKASCYNIIFNKGEVKMNKSLKFMVSVTLVTAIVPALLAGCKKQEKVPVQTSKPEEKLVQTAPIKIYTRTLNDTENKTDNSKVLDAVQQKSGVKIEKIAVPNDGFKDKVNLMIASSEEFDVLDITGLSSNWSQFKEKNALMPLNDLIDKYAPNAKKYMQNGFKVTSDKDGKIWAVPRREEFPMGFAPSIRTDWLKTLNMKMPTTMVEFEAYMEAVKTKDPNKNNKNDEIPLLSDWNLGGFTADLQPFFMGASGDRYLDKDGKVMPIYAHPAYKTMLDKIADWYAKGYIAKDFNTINGNQVKDLVINDRCGAYIGWYNSPLTPWVDLNKNNPEAEYTPLPVFKDAPSTGKAQWASNPMYSGSFVVPKTSKNAAFVFKLLDWQFTSTENMALMKFGLENDHFTYADKVKNIVQVTADASKKYTSFFNLVDFNEPTLTPTSAVNKDDKKAVATDRFKTILRGSDYSYAEPFDAAIPYNLKGTPAETITNDGKTKVEEARIQRIMGKIDGAGWEKAVQDYMKLEGNILTEEWTKQYKAYTGK